MSVLWAGIWCTGSADAKEADEAGASAELDDNGNPIVAARNQLGDPGAPTQSSGGRISCDYYLLGQVIGPFGYGGIENIIANATPVSEFTDAWWYAAACYRGQELIYDRVFQFTPGQAAPIDAQFLAQEAVDTLVIAFPDPHTSPSIEHDHLVGLATWLWIDPDGFEPVTATASIPGLSVTATATPTKVMWDMGDDTDPIVCDDPGTAYDTNRRPEDQSTDCSHVYQWHGDYTATATTTWEITWSATNGDGGTLPTIDRTTSFDLHVVERQAVVTG